jgi:hypothetical protein
MESKLKWKNKKRNSMWKVFKTVTMSKRENAIPSHWWEVNEFGDIRIRDRKGKTRIVKQHLTGGSQENQFWAISINDPKYVHRIVATAFVPNIYNAPYVIHKDGDQQNNYYKNLAWSFKKHVDVVKKIW